MKINNILIILIFQIIIAGFIIMHPNSNVKQFVEEISSDINELKNRVEKIALSNDNSELLLATVVEPQGNQQRRRIQRDSGLVNETLNVNIIKEASSDSPSLIKISENNEKLYIHKKEQSDLNFGDVKYTLDEVKLKIELRSQEVEGRLLYESVDAKWGREVAAVFDNLFKDKYLFDSKVLSNECKLTICRIKIKHYNLEAKKIFNKKLNEKFVWKGMMRSSSSDVNGNIITVLVLNREQV